MRDWVALGVATGMCLAGCEVPITNVCSSFTVERSVMAESVDRIDLLLVIDDSASMAEEQRRVADELAEVVRLLATGDRDGDGRRDFTSFRGVRVGVVRTSMGRGGAAACSEDAEAGMLVATTDRAGCPITYPDRIFGFGPAHGSADTADVGCLAALGTSGCGIEQPLEAMRVALDTPNFHREDALLAVVIVTDEDDCSHIDSLAGDAADPNAGCVADPVPLARYVDELRRHEPNPSRLSVAVIAGVPPELSPDLPYDELLAEPALQNVLGGESLVPSCASELGSASPPRRLITWLAALGDLGIQTGARSICAPLGSDFLDALLGYARGPYVSEGACVPRPLPRDGDGFVACEFELVLPPPSAFDGVTPTTCEAAGPDFVRLEPTRGPEDEPRERCLVPQLLATALAIGEDTGWGYDDSSDAARRCESGARLAFSGLESFHQVTFTLRCEQPLPEGAPVCEDAG